MVDVLLTHSYFMRFDRKQWRAMAPYAPLATLYAASVLRNAGIRTAIFDSMLAGSELELEDHIKKLSPRIVAIYDDCFNYLTKMCLTRMRLAAFKMISMSKHHGCNAIVFSPDSSDHAEEYLNCGADAVIKGEGEQTLLELCTKLLGDTRDIGFINGIAYTSDGNLLETPLRSPLRELDRLPMPAWDLIDVDKYKRAWSRHGYFSMNVVTTRGCPFGCNWCAKPIYGRVYNSRSPQNVVEEMQFLRRNYKPDHIWFCDDIFGLRPGWLEEFSSKISHSGEVIHFKCQSRPDLLLKEDAFKYLSSSGCETVWIGAESGSQRILDSMDKGTTVDQIRFATRRLKENKIKVGYFLQFGYPGETFKEIRQTLRLVREEMPDEIGISVSYPLPGTGFYGKVKSKLGTKQNWIESDDLALLFPGEYAPRFYRALHRLVHRVHRISRIMKGMEKTTMRSVMALTFNVLTFPFYLVILAITRKQNQNRVQLHEGGKC
ncbi:MAG: B12-binding domain-containing radical SAM protein [Candidatus Kryptoniota bacterium]